MKAAQERLAAAEGKLGSLTDSAGYRSAKAAASIVLGLMFGIVVATLGQLQMFALLGIDLVPAHIDVLITGLVIGSGSYPVHSLVGILQQGKNALDSVSTALNRQGTSPKQTAATPAPTVVVNPPAPVSFAAPTAPAQGVSFGLPMEPSAPQASQPSGVPGPLG
jgi:hypothetical protein